MERAESKEIGLSASTECEEYVQEDRRCNMYWWKMKVQGAGVRT
jgi:hypothetical protein